MIQAIDVISKVLALCGADAEQSESFQAVEVLGPRIRCQSCEAQIVMTFKNLVRILFLLSMCLPCSA
jgi:hypothetical protein